jgi:hypothetical protein
MPVMSLAMPPGKFLLAPLRLTLTLLPAWPFGTGHAWLLVFFADCSSGLHLEPGVAGTQTPSVKLVLQPTVVF